MGEPVQNNYNPASTTVPTTSLILGDGTAITISTTFGPTWEHNHAQPDVFIVSSDTVYFSVHTQRIYPVSANRFEGRIPEQRGPRTIASSTGPTVIALPEPSVVVQIMLYAIYGMFYGNQQPGFDAVAQTVEAMKKYWIHLHTYLAKGAPLYVLFLGQAPLRALEAFTIAAENELEALAVDVSPYVMPISPEDIPDDLTIRMGPLYLKRLWELRCTRREGMRTIVKTGPYPHAPSRRCSQADRLGLSRAWSLAGGQLIWNFRPEMSTSDVRTVLGSLSDHMSCEECKGSLHTRINDVSREWTLTQRTI